MAINWDKLNVGRMDLNHSEGYFDKRHLEHERLEDLFQGKLLSKLVLPRNVTYCVLCPVEKLLIVKEKNAEIKAKNQAKKKKEDKENVEVNAGDKGLQKQVEATIKRYVTSFLTNFFNLLFCLLLFYLLSFLQYAKSCSRHDIAVTEATSFNNCHR